MATREDALLLLRFYHARVQLRQQGVNMSVEYPLMLGGEPAFELRKFVRSDGEVDTARYGPDILNAFMGLVLSSDWIEQGRPSPSSLVIPPAIVQRGQYEHLLNVPTLTKYAEIYSSPAPFRAACAPRILEAHAIWRRVFNATEPVDVSNPATIVGEAAAYAALRTGVQALAAQCAGENVLWAEAMNAPLEVYKVENEDVYLDLGNEAVVEQVLPHLLAMVARAATARCCNVCGRRPRTPGLPKLRMCAGCRGVRYCGAACQRVDWPLHQAACREPVD